MSSSWQEIVVNTSNPKHKGRATSMSSNQQDLMNRSVFNSSSPLIYCLNPIHQCEIRHLWALQLTQTCKGAESQYLTLALKAMCDNEHRQLLCIPYRVYLPPEQHHRMQHWRNLWEDPIQLNNPFHQDMLLTALEVALTGWMPVHLEVDHLIALSTE